MQTNKEIRLVLVLTHNCNLNCAYCSIEPDTTEMSRGQIKNLHDRILESGIERITIQFFGGEPLLKISFIESLIGELKDVKKDIAYTITTNGTLLDDASLELIKKNKIRLSISIDGNKITHDSNRVSCKNKGSYELIVRNIDKIKTAGLGFTTEMVVTPDTVHDLTKNLGHLEALGCGGVFITPVCGQEWPTEYLRILHQELIKYAEKYLIPRKSRMEILNLKDKYECSRFNTELTIDCDGKVYTGNAFLINPNLKEITAIGDIAKDHLDDLLKKRQPESLIAEIIFGWPLVKSYKEAGKIIANFCNYVSIKKKIKHYDSLLKRISVFCHFNGGDMPYPPKIIWDKVSGENVLEAWQHLLNKKKLHGDIHKFGLYVHIPFCQSKCFFCMCRSKSLENDRELEEYLGYLRSEIALFRGLFEGLAFDSLYIGGGTPSLLNQKEMRSLLLLIHSNFKFKCGSQKAIEINPSSMSSDKWEILSLFGINRVTIGVQTADETIAKNLNRPQTRDQVIRAIENARKFGVKIINVDLIAGLPGQSKDSFKKTLQFIVKLKPDLVHINPFYPNKNTLFYKTGKEYTLEDIERKEELYKLGHILIKNLGLNMALNEKACVENKNLRYLQDYNSSDSRYNILGLGINAISHVQGELHYSKDDYDGYVTNIRANAFPPMEGYIISETEEMRAYVVKALEDEEGLNLSKFRELYKANFQETFRETINFMLKTRKAIVLNDFFKLTSQSRTDRIINSKYFFSKKVFEECKSCIDYIPNDKIDIELRKFT